jgi:two-component system heavy metal sensor histidine kinase CusS
VRWVLGIILIGYLGSIIARRSIAPLETFTARVATLSAGKLDLRVDTDNVPSELTQLADTFNELLGRLDEAFARLDAFSTDIAHELRSPIANLMTRSEVTLSRPRTLEESRLALESNAEEFERMRRMVEDMLFVARAENAAAAVVVERIDLAEVCATLAEYHSLGAEDAGLRIEVTGEGVTHGDPMLIRRAVSNLLSNAIRHATAGSTIQLVAAGRPGSIQSIEVSNVGEPIPPELQRTVFDRFVRGDTSRQRPRDGPGTGLGLAIVRSIMKLHGGHVEVQSGPEQRTLFRLVFPQSGAEGG